MLLLETLSALMLTLRTPFSAGPTATRSDHGRAPSSLRFRATPPPLGRRRLRLMFSKFHLLPRCWSSTTSLPFFRPISLRFCPSSPVRLRLSSQSSPASSPLLPPDGVADGGAAGGAAAGKVVDCPATAAPSLGRLATPVASGFA